MQAETIYRAIGAVAPAYDSFLTLSGHKRSVRKLVQELPIAQEEPIHVLDAGCGTGPYSFAVLNDFPNATVTAFDLNTKMIEEVRRSAGKYRNRLKVFTADVTEPLPFSDNEFDVLILSGILEHVDPDETVGHLSHFVRNGGYLLHSPLADTPYGKLIAHIYGCQTHSRKEYHDVFTGYGWKQEKHLHFSEFSPASFKEMQLYRKVK